MSSVKYTGNELAETLDKAVDMLERELQWCDRAYFRRTECKLCDKMTTHINTLKEIAEDYRVKS